MMSDPRYATQSSRASNIAEIYGELSELMKTRSTADWMALFEKADIPVARMNSVTDLVADPHLAASGFFEQEDHPTEGTLRTMRTPTSWSQAQPGPRIPPPRLGQHSAEVLREAGYSDAQIAELARSSTTLLGD
jgi:crotonobetainyl-CoA:carnitine CoA-transferase CaiB-like acyl-CoA transferase